MRNLRKPDKSAAAFEMSNINYAYNGRKYTYGYATRNFDLKEQNAITKVRMVPLKQEQYAISEKLMTKNVGIITIMLYFLLNCTLS